MNKIIWIIKNEKIVSLHKVDGATKVMVPENELLKVLRQLTANGFKVQ